MIHVGDNGRARIIPLGGTTASQVWIDVIEEDVVATFGRRPLPLPIKFALQLLAAAASAFIATLAALFGFNRVRYPPRRDH